MENNNEQQKQISNIIAMFMVAVALFFDALVGLFWLFHLVPIFFIGNIFASISTTLVNVFAGMVMTLWFVLLGVKLMNKKRVATMASGWVIGTIPLLNIIPAWTLATILTIATTRSKVLNVASGGNLKK